MTACGVHIIEMPKRWSAPASLPINRFKGTTMSKINSLTVERVKELLSYDPETGIFTRRTKQNNRMKVGEVAGANNGGYTQLSVDGRGVKAHRLAWFYVYGVWPSMEIDHINGVRSDNRIANLRDVDKRTNCQNRFTTPAHSSEEFIGATKDKRCRSDIWVAQININGKHHHIGRFRSPEEAHLMYLLIKQEFHAGYAAQGEHHSFQ